MARADLRAAFDRGVAWVSRGAAVVAGLCFVYVAVGTMLGVFSRYVMNTPSRFLFDSVEIAMGLTVFLALAFVCIHNGHVRMEVIPASRETLREKLGRIANLVSALVLGAYSIAVFSQFFKDIQTGIKLGSNFGLPRWVPMLVLASGLMLFALALLRRADATEELEEVASS